MESLNKILTVQMDHTVSDVSWFAAFEKAVSGVDGKEAAWRSPELENSIWDIVKHMNFWNERNLRRFKGEDLGTKDFTNESTFFKSDSENSHEWEKDLQSFYELMNEWKETILAASNDKKVYECAFGETEWWEQILNINLHNAYHIGQIVLIRKLQGTWNPVDWDS